MTDSRRLGSTALVLIALAAGLLAGVAISLAHSPVLLGLATRIEFFGTLWTNAIRMTVVPLVVSLLFTSMTSFADLRAAGRLGVQSLLLFAASLAFSAAFAVLAVPLAFSWMPGYSGGLMNLGDFPTVAAVREQAQNLPGVTQWLADLVPVNPIRAAADGAMLPLVIFSTVFGLASATLPPASRGVLNSFFAAVGDAMLTIVRWLIALAPLGVFALVLPLAARLGTTAAGAFGYYVLVMSSLLSVLALMLYPASVLLARVPARVFFRALFPAQAIALSSRSSLASLPALIEGAELELQCPPRIAGFVLPLAVSVFKITAPLIWMTGACFIARLYGVPLGGKEFTAVIGAGFLASFVVPGIPMGSVIMLTPLFTSIGLPVEGVGILIALDLIPDIFKTLANVTGDMFAVAVLARRHNHGVDGDAVHISR